MGNARITALIILEKCRRNGAWSDALLGSVLDASNLDERDRRLATTLCYGVLQNLLLLDYIIEQCSSIPNKKIEPKVLDILRLSIFQIIFLEKIPASAAVNEGVAISKKTGFSRASSYINAVLRKVAAGNYTLPSGNTVQDLSVRYSHPQWFVEYLVDILGFESAEAYLKSDNSSVPLTVQVNTLRTTTDSVSRMLEEEKVIFHPHPFLDDCLYIDSGSVASLPSFLSGYYYVQDVAAKMSILAANPSSNDRILDVCAAPGGKTFAAAILSQSKDIVSCDLHSNKIKRIQDGINRMKLSGVTCLASDAKVFNPDFEGKFDLVIADVPCSGLGVIRKKPDIRYKDMHSFDQLNAIQLEILDNVSRYVTRGGVLLYSTCTIRMEENIDVINRFLVSHPQFSLEDFSLPGGIFSNNGQMQMWPHIHDTDGFYFAKMRNSCD